MNKLKLNQRVLFCLLLKKLPIVEGHINVPDKMPVIDGFLAATALVHDLTLVTRNVRDVGRSGVKLLNPFLEQSSPF